MLLHFTPSGPLYHVYDDLGTLSLFCCLFVQALSTIKYSLFTFVKFIYVFWVANRLVCVCVPIYDRPSL